VRVIHVRLMNEADLPLGMRLKTQAGWNQLEADWRRFLEMQPDGCFVAELDGIPVGTTNTCIFGPVAWIAMVLVEAEVRGQGVGKALMRHALAFLDEQSVRTVRLDATPMGQPLYEKLGFVEEYNLVRYEGTPQTAGSETRAERMVATAKERDWDDLAKLDQSISSTDRRKFLMRLFAERPESVRVVRNGGDIVGYMTVRPGVNALQVGPCMGTSEAGPMLLADAWQRYAGQRVFVDIPTGNTIAVRLAEQMGLKVQRPLVRMCRGPAIAEDCTRLWASSGPELG
jgi:GNAT superfamily N-acetyltransferase